MAVLTCWRGFEMGAVGSFGFCVILLRVRWVRRGAEVLRGLRGGRGEERIVPTYGRVGVWACEARRGRGCGWVGEKTASYLPPFCKWPPEVREANPTNAVRFWDEFVRGKGGKDQFIRRLTLAID